MPATLSVACLCVNRWHDSFATICYQEVENVHLAEQPKAVFLIR